MPLINTATGVYVGSTPATRVYAGTTPVWPQVTKARPTLVAFSSYQGTGAGPSPVALPNGSADGDLLVCAFMGVNSITAFSLTGWTVLMPFVGVNTRVGAVLGRVRQAGDPATYDFVQTGNGSRTLLMCALRNTTPVAGLVIGPTYTRPSSIVTSTAKALTSTGTASVTLAIFMEASTVAEAAGDSFVPTMTGGFTHWASRVQSISTNLESIEVATLPTGPPYVTTDCVATYPNTSANGIAVQIAVPAK